MMKERSYPQSQSLFTVVEVEVNSKCNRKCDYCPASLLSTKGLPDYMSAEIFNKLISELEDLKFSGKISYHHYSEPLLRFDLEDLVSQVRWKLPNVYQLLYTNGDFLSDQRYSSLITAGINHFIVTRHDFSPMPERPRQTIKFPSELIIVNRGGFFSKLPKSLTTPCYGPSEILMISISGDVLLCPDDAEKKYIMGNIMRQSLVEIWFSEKFIHTRGLLKRGMRNEASSICRMCNNEEYFASGEA